MKNIILICTLILSTGLATADSSTQTNTTALDVFLAKETPKGSLLQSTERSASCDSRCFATLLYCLENFTTAYCYAQMNRCVTACNN